MSEESQAQLDSSFMSLKNIRDGDWRLRRTEKEEGNRAKIDYGDSQNENFVDDRLEGTPAYLPPEVLQRITRIRDNLRDSWALGCVAHFCLEGRPRYFGSTDEVLQQIKFETEIENADGSKGSTHLVHFADSGEDTDDARTLVLENLAYHNFISGLNNFNPLDRLRISQALFHDYLSKGILTEADSAGIDFPVVLNPTTLHQSPPIALPQPRKRARTSELGDDQLWARRQFSVLWSPMPDDLKPEENVEADKKKVSTYTFRFIWLNATRLIYHSLQGLTECHASDIWLSSHPHLMIPIKESAEEFGSAFLAPNHR